MTFPAILASGANAGTSSASATQSTGNINNTAGTNHKVVAFAFIAINETIDSAVYGTVPMLKGPEKVVQTDATRYLRLCYFYLDNPPVQNAPVTVTRASATSARMNVQATILTEVPAGPPDVVKTYFDPTNLSAYTTDLTTLTADSLVIAAFAGSPQAAGVTATPVSGQTLINVIQPSAGLILSVTQEQVAAIGTTNNGWTTSADLHNAGIIALAFKYSVAVTLLDVTLSTATFPTHTPQGTRLAQITNTSGGVLTLGSDDGGRVAMGTGADAGWIVQGATPVTVAAHVSTFDVIETKVGATNTPHTTSVSLTSVDLIGTRYYVRPDTGADANDGLTVGTAVKSWDRAVALVNASGQANDVIDMPRAIPFAKIRAAAPTFAAFELAAITVSGKPGNRIKIEASGAGEHPRLCGDMPVPDWVASQYVHVAGIEKHTFAGFPLNFASHVSHGRRRLYPAQYPHPSAIDNFNNSDGGSDAFFWLGAAEVDYTGYNAAKELSFDKTAGSAANGRLWIRSAARLARYAGASLIGCVLYMRGLGSQTQWAKIKTHDQVNHEITVDYIAGQNPPFGYDATNVPVPALSARQRMFWAIRYHPLDVVQPGQYGWEGDPVGGNATVHAIFPPGAKERSIVVLGSGLRAAVDDIEINGVKLARFGRDSGDKISPTGSEHGLIFTASSVIPGIVRAHRWNIINSGAEHVTTGAADMMAAIGLYGGNETDMNSDWLIDGFTVEGSETGEGFRFLNLKNSTIRNFRIRETGGTALYVAGYANNNEISDGDNSDTRGQHANALTVSYQGAYHNNVDRFFGANTTNGLTSQTKTYVVPDKGTEITSTMISSRMMSDDIPLDASKAVRIDDGWTNGLIGGSILVIGESGAGITFASAQEGAKPNTGLRVQSVVAEQIAVDSAGVAGVIFRDVYLLNDTTTNGNPSSWTGFGATVVRAAVAAPETAWNGFVTDAMWEVLSRNLDGAGAYEARQIGADWAAWTFPAYGTNFTRGELKLTSTKFMRGVQPRQVMASVVGMMPDETYSIDESFGVGADWEIIVGQFRSKAGVADPRAGQVKLVSVCAHALCTNPGTRESIVTLQREDYSLTEEQTLWPDGGAVPVIDTMTYRFPDSAGNYVDRTFVLTTNPAP